MKSKNKNATVPENDSPNNAIYDEVAKYVAEHYESSKKCVLEIGGYLLTYNFEGDIEAVKSKRPGKTLSLRVLAKRGDINMSLASLSRAVNLAAQEKELESVPTSEQFSLSHKEVLLRVKDLETKKRYMEIAVEEKLSVRQLRARLKKDGVTAGAGTGKDSGKAESPVRRHLRTTFEFLKEFEPIKLKQLDDDAAQETLAEAVQAQRGLTKVIDILKKRAEERTKKAA